MARPSPWWLRIAFGLALVVTLGFGLRFAAGVVYWANPANRDQPVEAWMPVGFVARSWQVPPEFLAEALGIPESERTRQTLEQIARARGTPVAEVIVTLETAIAGWRASRDE